MKKLSAAFAALALLPGYAAANGYGAASFARQRVFLAPSYAPSCGVSQQFLAPGPTCSTCQPPVQTFAAPGYAPSFAPTGCGVQASFATSYGVQTAFAPSYGVGAAFAPAYGYAGFAQRQRYFASSALFAPAYGVGASFAVRQRFFVPRGPVFLPRQRFFSPGFGGGGFFFRGRNFAFGRFF